MSSPSVLARAQKKQPQKMQEGTLLSFTVVRHPPAGFTQEPRRVGLIELVDGTKVHSRILAPENAELVIGMRVSPCMRLSKITEQGLRIYEIAYRVLIGKPVQRDDDIFPGYILALSGPSGVGKSTISKLSVKALSDHLAPVPILTTRAPKKGDDGEYHYVSEKNFQELRKKGEIIAIANIPSRSEKRWYGYLAKDIEAIWDSGKTPVVVTEMNLLQDLAKHYGRRSILSLGLLPPGKSKRIMLSQLLHRLRHRGRDTEESIQDRIRNAEKDLAFFEEHHDLFDHILVNEDLDAVVKMLQGHVMALQKA